MTRLMQEARYALERRELIAIEAACDHLLKCESGELWITVEGPRDIVLGPGESYRVDTAGAAVVSALKAGVLAVAYPREAKPACRPRKEGAAWTLAGLLRWKVAPLAGAPATRIG